MRVKLFVMLTLAIIMFFPSLSMGVEGTHFFDCTECHLSGGSLTELAGGNICIRCHDAASPRVTRLNKNSRYNPAGNYNIASLGTFDIGDASDAHDSNPLYNSAETSHHWALSSTYSAEAGSREPNRAQYPNMYSKYNASTGKITCSRCHDPHGDYATNPKLLRLSPDNLNPMTENDLCVACHSDFAGGVAAPGNDGFMTHPVMNSTELIAITSGNPAFNMAGVENYNSATAYYNGAVLVDGGVSCMSCHSPHFSDSDSSTSDGPGLATTGDGLLLRSDGPTSTGVTRNATAQKRSNLCQTCHNYQMHGEGVDDTEHQIGCLDCHGGHSFNGGTPNAYVLIDQSLEPLPTRINGTNSAPAPITFGTYNAGDAADSRNVWSDDTFGSANGLCEKCHGDVQDPSYIGGLTVEHLEGNLNQCSGCHLHNGTGWTQSFQVDASAASCGACHGFPPHLSGSGNRDSGGVDGGYAWNDVDLGPPADWDYFNDSGYYKDEAFTPHDTHAGNVDNPNYYFVGQSGIENCQPCHGNDAGSPAGGHREPGVTETFRDVIFNEVATYNGSLSPVYNPGAATCNLVYCHTDGAPRIGPTSATRDFSNTHLTPGWENGKDAFFGLSANARCQSCHGNNVATMSNASPAHIKHLSAPYNYDCTVCHIATVSDSTTLQPGATDGRSGGTHVNSVADVTYDPSFIGGMLAGETYAGAAAVNGTCSLYCHDAPDPVNPTGTGRTVDWDVAGPLGCNDCHADQTSSFTSSHQRHVDGANGPQLACADCHGAGSDAGTHSSHVDGVLDILPPVDGVTFASICDECHGYDAEAGEVLPVWGNAGTTDCATCHAGLQCGADIGGQPAPSFGFARLGGHNRPTSSGTYPQSGNPAANSDCDDCHITDSPLHWDGSSGDFLLRTDLGFPATYAGNENNYCGNCHGVADASHGKEAAATLSIVTHQSKDCIACHNVHGDSNIQMIWNSQLAQNSHDNSLTGKYAANVTFTNTTNFTLPSANSYDEDDGVAGATGENGGANHDDICASCHSDTAATTHNNREGTDNQAPGGHQIGSDCNACHTPHDDAGEAFIVAAGTACNDCHGFPPATGAHALHSQSASNDKDVEDRTDCAFCHSGADVYTYNLSLDQAAGGDRANHGVGQATREAALNTAIGYTSVDGSCATACHNSTAGDGSWSDANGLNCDACHYASNSPSGAANITVNNSEAISKVAHDDHFNAGKDCVECHSVSYSPTIAAITGPLAHITDISGADEGAVYNGMANALADEADVVRASMTFNDSPNTCSGSGVANGCHATGTPDWDIAIPADSTGCVQCHTTTTNSSFDPTTGLHGNTSAPTVTGESHDDDFDGSSADCITCHSATPSASHIDGTFDTGAAVNVEAIAGYNQGNGTCATACHSAGTTWDYLWSTDVFNSDGTECYSCHGTYANGWNTGVIHNESGKENRGAIHNATGTLTYPCADCHAIGATTGNYDWTSMWDPTGSTSNHGDGIITMNDTTNMTPVEGARAGCNTTSCHNSDALHDFLITSTGLPRTPIVVGDEPQVACSNCHGGTSGTSANGYWPDDPSNDHETGPHTSEDDAGEHAAHVLAIAQQYLGQASIAQLLTNSAGSTGPYNTWTSDAKQQEVCTFCHDNPGSDGDHGQLGNLPAETNSFYTSWNKTVDNGSWNSVADTCATTDCHFNKTTPDNTYGWYDGGSSACVMCHVNVTTENTHTDHTDGGFGRTIGCADCHDAVTAWGTPPSSNHIDGTYQIGNTAGSSVAFDYSAGSCGTNACHEDGKGGAPLNNSYVWTDNNLGDCTICHNNPPAFAQTGNSGTRHTQHMSSGLGYACTDCHTAATAATHIDNTTQYGGSSSMNYAAAPGCTNNCHIVDTARGDWTDTDVLACTDCHNSAGGSYVGDGGNFQVSGLHNNTSAPTLTSESHDDNFDSGKNCESCHTATPSSAHIDGSLDDSPIITVAGDVSTFVDGTPPRCATSCHTAGTNWQYVWSTDSYNSDGTECNGCHGQPANAWNVGTIHDDVPAKGGAHTTTGNLTYPCTDCHTIGATTAVYDWTQSWDPTGSNSNHGDGVLQMNNTNTNFADDSTWAGCNGAGCHGMGDDAHRFPSITGTTNWTISQLAGTEPAVSCSGCHGNGTVGTNQNNYWPDDSNANVENTSGAHQEHMVKLAAAVYTENIAQLLTNNGNGDSDVKQKELCAYCHEMGDGDHGNNANMPAETLATANDGNAAGSGFYEMWEVPRVDRDSADYDIAGNGSCYVTDCHAGKATDAEATKFGWYDGNPSQCITCHNEDDVTLSGNVGGASHLSHTDASGNSMGPDIACSSCHDAATDWVGNTVPGDGNHIDGTMQASGSVSFTYSAGSCGTNDCHSSGQYSGASPVAPKTIGYTWGTPIAGCAACHEATSGTLSTGSHGVHFTSAVQNIVNCNECHTGETAATHYDGNVDFASAGSNYNGGSPEPNSDESFSSCGTNNCHNDGKNGAPAAYTWNANGGACNICHDDEATSALTSEAHDTHLNADTTFGLTIDCDDCHGLNAVTGQHANHVDTDITMTGAASGYNGDTAITGSTFGSCGTNACHENGLGGAPAVGTYNWNTTQPDCTLCHNSANMTSGSHTEHISATYGPMTGTDCGACHAANANNTTMAGMSNHINGTNTFSDNNVIAATDACDNCHGNSSGSNGGLITTARANWAGSTSVSCESCHGAGDLATENADGTGVVAPDRGGASYTAVGHGLTTGAAPNQVCSNCHTTATAHISGSLNDANRLVTQGGFNYETGGQENDYCNDCHATSMFPHYGNSQTPGGSSTDGLLCYVCHEPHGNSGFDAMIRDNIGGNTVAGFTLRGQASSYKNASNNGVCQACHDTEVSHYNRSTNSGSHNVSANCASCHDHTADPGFSASGGGCTSCHNDGAGGSWPQTGGTIPNVGGGVTGGKHLEHVSAIALEAYGVDNETNRNNTCQWCHSSPGTAPTHNNGNIDVDDIRHILNYAAGTDGNAVVNGDNTPNVTCSTVDCHFNNAVTPHWYDDNVAPANVSLTAVPGPNPRSIKVSWNAPGDDNNVANTTPYVYDLRIGTSAGVAQNYTLDTNYAGNLPAAYAQGFTSEAIIENLNPASTYFFNLRTRDTAGNWSGNSTNTPSTTPTADTEAPAFGGPNKAIKADKSQALNVFWTPAEDHSMPMTYDIWVTDEASLPINYNSAATVSYWPDHSIQLDNNNASLANDTIYYVGVRACDAQGNCDTNTINQSATPTDIAPVDKSYHSYPTNGSTVLLKDGSAGTGASSAAPVVFAPASNLTYPVTYFVDTFAVFLNVGNTPGTARAEIGFSTNGTNFTGSGKFVEVGYGKRSDRVYQFKLVDTSGVTITAGQRIAIQVTDQSATGITVQYGSASDRGDMTAAERIVNTAPTQPGSATTQMNPSEPGLVDIAWAASTDSADGLSDTVHYDIYGSDDNGANYDYLIASEVTGTSYQWNAQEAGVPFSSTVAVQVVAGDGYDHSVARTYNGLSMPASDGVKPGQITDLTAVARPKSGSVQLMWTAPGDDGKNNGRADYYDVRYSTSAINNDTDFNNATEVTHEPYPGFGGDTHEFEVTGLNPGTTYYFAIKTVDENGNTSVLNTVQTAGDDQEVGGPRCGMCHTTAPSVVESVGNHKLHGFTLNDCDKCHDDGSNPPSSYGLDHQDGSLVMGYGPGGAHTGHISGSRIYYTDDGTPGGTVLYDDTDGFGGFGDGTYTDVGPDFTDSGTCVSFGTLGVGGCHGSAGTDPDGGGSAFTTTLSPPEWNAAATLNCAECHGNIDRTTDQYGRAYDAGVDDQIISAPSVDNHGNFLDDGSGTEGQRKYIGQHEKHLNYSFRFSKNDSCNLCHAGEYRDKASLDGKHANGVIDIELDLNAAGSNAQWNPGTPTTAGTCSNMSPDSCHPSTDTPKWDTAETFDCVGCHDMGGDLATLPVGHYTDPAQGITLDSDGTNTLEGGPMLGNCTWCHFAGHPRDDVGGAALILPNSSQVGINYRSGGIHLRASIGGRAAATTEAELCWNCHDSNSISEWGTDDGSNNISTRPSNLSDYDYGTLSTSNWTTATWYSAYSTAGGYSDNRFGYKQGAIQSTHSTNETGTAAISGTGYGRSESPDSVNKIRCSNCHDVHNLNKAPGDNMTGNPYLRGSWIRNPYLEDGAPWSGQTYNGPTDYGDIPRGGVNDNDMGGWQIDQNNGNPTAGLSLATSAGLCTLCHGSDVDNMDKVTGENLWMTAGRNGHSNAALGGTAAASKTTNIFGWGVGGRPTPSNDTDGSANANDVYDMGAMNLIEPNPRGYSYRSPENGTGKFSPAVASRPYAFRVFAWNMTADASSIDVGYHAFTCSKCHNPHASRLPKLMITNCLDTGHNTWDNAQGSQQNFWNSSADSGEWTATHNTAQNCHRYDAVDNTGGWNYVTPW